MGGVRWLQLSAVASIMAVAAMSVSVGLGGTAALPAASASTHVQSRASTSAIVTTAMILRAAAEASGAVPQMVCGGGPGSCYSVWKFNGGPFAVNVDTYLYEHGYVGFSWQGAALGCGGGLFGVWVSSFWIPVGGWMAAGAYTVGCLSGTAWELIWSDG